MRDARFYQIATLAVLVAFGITCRDFTSFGLGAVGIALILTVGLCTQFLATALHAKGRFEAKSALISCLSLILLLRASEPLYLAVAAFLAISSKFLFRLHGKHVFNPTNFALTMMLLFCSPEVWVSPAQWGYLAVFGASLACVGVLVVTRAGRADITIAFLIAYIAIVIGRAVWLEDPIDVPLHSLANGGLVLFSFFMISDPRTTPDSRAGRILFAILVAALGAYIQLWLYKPRGIFYALCALSPLTPVLDALWRAPRFQWGKISASFGDFTPGGTDHAAEVASPESSLYGAEAVV